jgi:hypothetical protein
MKQLNIIHIIGTKEGKPTGRGGEGTPKPPAVPQKGVDGFSLRRAKNKQSPGEGESVVEEEPPLFI